MAVGDGSSESGKEDDLVALENKSKNDEEHMISPVR